MLDAIVCVWCDMSEGIIPFGINSYVFLNYSYIILCVYIAIWLAVIVYIILS